LTHSENTTSRKLSSKPLSPPNYLPRTKLPSQFPPGFFEISASTLQAPDLPQIFPPKESHCCLSLPLSDFSTPVLGINNLLPQTTLV